jgi:hypothetical protein
MNEYPRNPSYGPSRGKGAAVICAVVSVILAAAVAAGIWVTLSKKAAEEPVKTNEETIIPNISANMIYAIDPAVIENYRATHNSEANRAVYRFLPENGFTTPEYVNTDITVDCVSPVTSLSIDMKQNEDLTALPYFKNLSVLRISHAEFLTDADIAEMNKLNLSEVEFIINRDDITPRQKFADFTQCACANKHITLLNGDFINENTAYAIYHLFGRFYPSVPCDGLDYDFYRRIDEKLQTLIDKVDFTNCQTDKDRLLKCMVVVMKHLYYDEEVSDYSQVNNDIYEGTYIYNLCVSYNEHQLSSNLLVDGDRGYGCCTNFTSLLLAVCVKLDIEAYMVDGKRSNDVGFLHDWIYAPADGEGYCIDMTESNRWFKRSAGMFHRYNSIVIEGDKDIMDDPDFYASFHKQVFETYNNKIFSDYVFFVQPQELIPQIDTQKVTLVYNAAEGPVEKYIPDYEAGKTGIVTKSAAAGGIVLVLGLIVTVIVAKRRGRYVM